jgi:hypothetical protein
MFARRHSRRDSLDSLMLPSIPIAQHTTNQMGVAIAESLVSNKINYYSTNIPGSESGLHYDQQAVSQYVLVFSPISDY